jgi:Ca-activated chloride channel family protein
MHFAQPVFLIVALALGVALVALFVHLSFSRRRALALLGAKHLLANLTASVSIVRRRIKEAMVVTGVVLVGVALARPQWGFRWEEAHRRGVDVLFAVDTSKSMLTPDVKPNRLERAKLAVRDLVQKFPDDRVGLVAFAGSAFLETPLTLDHSIFEQSLDGLDTNVIPLGGTNVASAIDVAEKALANDEHKKVLVLLTDGEDLSGDAINAAEAAAKKGLVVYTVGVGTPHGELIPIASKGGQTRFVKDDAGNFVTSKLDESLLRRIATVTSGSYRALGDNGQGLESLYRDELATLPRSDLAARSEKVPIERYQWPLGIGLLFLGIEPMIRERRRTRVRATAKSQTPARRRPLVARLAAPSAAALATMLLIVPSAFASPQSAERAYKEGQFAKAESDYAGAAKKAPTDPRLEFNLGAAAYRTGDLDAATKSFESALHTDDLKLQQRAYYNLGDATYRGGEKTLKDGKTDDTIRTWKQSVSDYEAALRLDRKDADAQYNLDFVKKRLADLQKKQDEKKQEDKKEQDKKDQQNKDQKSKSGGKDSKDKKPGDQGQDKSSQGDSKGQPKDSKSGQGDQDKNAQGKPQQGQGPQDQAQKGQGTPQQPQGQNPGQPQPNAQQPNGQPQPNGQAPNNAKPGDREEAEGPSRAGELSKGEARALLDSLRGELQIKPTVPATPTPQDQPQKDW